MWRKYFSGSTRSALMALLVGAAGFASAAQAGFGAPGKPSAVKRSIDVSMSDQMRFTPARIEVKRGETIRLRVKNEGQVRHELVLGLQSDLKHHAELMRRHPHMEHDDPHAVSVPPGETREIVWRFTRGGRVDFACLIPGHYEAGMQGRVEVK